MQTSDLLEEAVDRHRPLRLRRAQRAAGDHGDGPGRHVRAADARARTCTRCASASQRGLACRGPALFSVFAGAPAGAGAAAALPERRRGDGVARLPGLHLRRRRRRQLGRRASRSRTTRSPRTTGRSRRLTYADDGAAARQRALRLHLRRLRALRPRATPRTSRWCRASAGTRRWCRPPTGWRCDEATPAQRVPYVLAVDGRRCAAARDRRRAADAGHAPLPAAVAPAAGARRRPRLARRAAAGAREGRVGGAKQATARRARRRRGAAAAPQRRGAAAAGDRGRRAEPAATRATRPGSTPRAARAATSASSSTTGCSATTSASRPTSRT